MPVSYNYVVFKFLSCYTYLTRDYYGSEDNFPRHNKIAESAFRVSVGMGHDTLHVAFNMFYAMPTTMSSKVRKMGE